MKLAERDFRLEQIRKERAELEQSLRDSQKRNEKKLEETRKRIQRQEAKKKSIWREMFTFSLGIGDFFESSGNFAAATIDSSVEAVNIIRTRRKIKELTEEEAKLLGLEIDDSPEVNQNEKRKNEIFQRRSNRLLEKETRIRQETSGKARADWTDEELERVKRLENAYEQADARDIQELSKIL